MDFISPVLLEEIENHLKLFDDLFMRSEQREYFRYTVAGLLSETQIKNIEKVIAGKTE